VFKPGDSVRLRGGHSIYVIKEKCKLCENRGVSRWFLTLDGKTLVGGEVEESELQLVEENLPFKLGAVVRVAWGQWKGRKGALVERAPGGWWVQLLAPTKGCYIFAEKELAPYHCDSSVEPPVEERKESAVGARMTTYAYEVLVCAKRNKDGEIVRPPQKIGGESGLLERPEREDLLMKYAAEIKALDARAEEVAINIVPFARD
jgi:hypothetical protein